MRKLVVTEFITLDGVIEDPGGSEGTPHGGWNFKYWSDDIGEYKFAELRAADAQLLGRVTYQGFAASWPNMTELGEFADRMNGMPKYVASTTLQTADWNNSHILRDNIPAAVARLKQQPGADILVAGSATLAQTLRQHNLIDEYRLLVHPVVLGSGKRLFPDGSPSVLELKLVDSRPFAGGVIALTFVPAAAAETQAAAGLAS
jgi:dihydrofolate reductase